MLDIFGTAPVLFYKGLKRQRSCCGVTLTYFFIGFVIMDIYFLCKDLFARDNPKTNQVDQFFENPEAMLISPDTFYVSVGLQHPETFLHYIDPSIYQVNAVYHVNTRYKDSNGEINIDFGEEPLELIPCNDELYGSSLRESVKHLELPNLFCINPKQPNIPRLELSGKFESEVFKHITVDFSVCKNGTSPVVCKPKEEIDALLDGAYFAAYYSDATISLKDYDNPRIRFLDSTFTTFGQSYYKEYSAYVRNLDVWDDIGLIFEDSRLRTYQRFDKILEVSDFRKFDNFFRLVLRMSPIKSTYYRTYPKATDMLAKLNGTVAFVVVVIATVAYPFIRTKFYEDLINEVFDVRLFRDEHQSDKAKLIKLESRIVRKGTRKQTTDLKKQLEEEERREKEEEERKRREKENKKKRHVSKKTSNQPIMSKLGSEYLIKPVSKGEIKDSKSHKQNKERSQGHVVTFQNMDQDENRGDISANSTFNKKLLHADKNENQDFSDNKLRDFNYLDSDRKNLNSRAFHKLNTDQKRPQVKVLESEHNDPDESLTAKTNSQPFSADQLDDKLNHSDVILPSGEVVTQNQLQENAKDQSEEQPQSDDHEISIVEPRQNDDSSYEDAHKVFMATDGVRLSFVEFIRSFFSADETLMKKIEMMQTGTHLINERMDIFNLITKIREIDKLKAILLDDDQLKIFNSLPKPVLDKESKKLLMDRISRSAANLAESDFIKKVNKEEVKRAHKRIIEKPQKSIIDLRMLAIYDDDLI